MSSYSSILETKNSRIWNGYYSFSLIPPKCKNSFYRIIERCSLSLYLNALKDGKLISLQCSPFYCTEVTIIVLSLFNFHNAQSNLVSLLWVRWSHNFKIWMLFYQISRVALPAASPMELNTYQQLYQMIPGK